MWAYSVESFLTRIWRHYWPRQSGNSLHTLMYVKYGVNVLLCFRDNIKPLAGCLPLPACSSQLGCDCVPSGFQKWLLRLARLRTHCLKGFFLTCSWHEEGQLLCRNILMLEVTEITQEPVETIESAGPQRPPSHIHLALPAVDHWLQQMHALTSVLDNPNTHCVTWSPHLQYLSISNPPTFPGLIRTSDGRMRGLEVGVGFFFNVGGWWLKPLGDGLLPSDRQHL